MERVPAAAPQALTIGCPEDLAPVGEALSALDIGLTLVDRDLRIQWANDWVRRAAVELTCGASHCFTALWQETRRCSDCLPVLVFGTGEPREGVRERGRPGEPREAFRVRAVPVRDGSGQVRWVAESFVRLSGMGLDLAGRRADALDEAAAGAALVVVDREERIVSWGGAAAAIFGYALEEALGRRVDLIVPPGREAEESALAARVEAEGRAPRMETERRARDGRLVPVALTASAVRDESGRLVGRSCLVEDLSALHRLRDQVAAQDQLLAHITREAADAILGVDRQGTVTSWNRGAERLLGLTAAQVVGRPLATVARPDDVERL
ncbi:MAG TPA: PAS domain S-box protein, partial [Anaeromyxobacteraceae bacterium]